MRQIAREVHQVSSSPATGGRSRLTFRAPSFRYGQRVECLARGEVVIVGLTDALVPWPIGKTKRAKSLVLYRDLARAVRREANRDVARLFGVTGQTVTKWRRALGVPANNRGTLRRRVEAGKRNRRGLAAMHAKARDPVRRTKIAAAKRGNRLGLRELCERYVNDQWFAAHASDELAAEALLEQFKRAVLGELELLQVRAVRA